jgi:hypothetical protein
MRVSNAVHQKDDRMGRRGAWREAEAEFQDAFPPLALLLLETGAPLARNFLTSSTLLLLNLADAPSSPSFTSTITNIEDKHPA